MMVRLYLKINTCKKTLSRFLKNGNKFAIFATTPLLLIHSGALFQVATY